MHTLPTLGGNLLKVSCIRCVGSNVVCRQMYSER